MFLPLHIFEPRYRQMTADALEGERLIAMALLKPDWKENYEGSPPIHDILGVGKIVDDTKLADGRYNLACSASSASAWSGKSRRDCTAPLRWTCWRSRRRRSRATSASGGCSWSSTP